MLKRAILSVLASFLLLSSGLNAADMKLEVEAGKPVHEISDIMYGLFFEDINFAADGGLYAEMVWNRSFEFSDGKFSWEMAAANGAESEFTLQKDKPLNDNNPTYLGIDIQKAGDVTVATDGFHGMAIEAGKAYDLSIYIRSRSYKGAVKAELRTQDGRLAGSARITGLSDSWKKHQVKIKSGLSDTKASLVLVLAAAGKLDIDMVSLFPEDTWKKQPNGLRADIVKILADMKPGFLRFPGGCIVEGKTLDNAYRWKDTIGDPAERKVNWNRWGGWNNPPQYYQSYGLGFFEYFRLCEDIGAEPVPILNCGMSCQYQDAELVPLDQLDPYVQDALDLIEYANGPASSTWGSKRAASGHPAPFGLKVLGVGNEQWGEQYFERYKIFYDAIKAKYPKIKIVTTSGPSSDGKWYDLAWGKFKAGVPADIVDEHYYRPPAWFLANNKRYDSYERNGIEIFAGEYAAHQNDRRNDLYAALSEASFMTGLERNGDVVTMAAYAPMLAHHSFTQWAPDLVWFDGTRVYGSPSYYVQKLFSRYKGTHYFNTTVKADAAEAIPAGKIGLCTWNTDSEYKDVKVARGGNVLYSMNNFDSWKVLSGKWGYADGVVRQSDANAQGALCLFGSENWNDYTLSLKARKKGGREGFIIVFRRADSEKGLQLNLGGWGNATHAIQSTDAGGSTSVVVEKPGTIDTDRWYDIKVELSGIHVKCSLDGEVVFEKDIPVSTTPELFASTTTDKATGKVFLKVINPFEKPVAVDVNINGMRKISSEAKVTVLTGPAANAVNSLDNPVNVMPVESVIYNAGSKFNYVFKPLSMTVIELKKADAATAVKDQKAYIFSYFKGNGEDGLHLAYSYDGLGWVTLKNDTSFLTPQIGTKLMRDPSVVQGPDGTFHMVWTSGWHDSGIGMAHSKDLIHWGKQQDLQVMAHEPTARNCWAPEIFYDDVTKTYIIYWATTIPGRFPETDNPKDDNNHRIYCVKTKDFKTFTDTELFFDPGFNVIDSFIAKDQASGKYIMFLKNETKHPKAQKNLSIAMADKAAGPYGKVSKPITGKYWAEGPTALKVGDNWIVYFDKYTEHRYGAISSCDLVNWTDISNFVSIPSGIRHGTTFVVDRAVVDNLLKYSK